MVGFCFDSAGRFCLGFDWDPDILMIYASFLFEFCWDSARILLDTLLGFCRDPAGVVLEFLWAFCWDSLWILPGLCLAFAGILFGF